MNDLKMRPYFYHFFCDAIPVTELDNFSNRVSFFYFVFSCPWAIISNVQGFVCMRFLFLCCFIFDASPGAASLHSRFFDMLFILFKQAITFPPFSFFCFFSHSPYIHLSSPYFYFLKKIWKKTEKRKEWFFLHVFAAGKMLNLPFFMLIPQQYTRERVEKQFIKKIEFLRQKNFLVYNLCLYALKSLKTRLEFLKDVFSLSWGVRQSISFLVEKKSLF